MEKLREHPYCYILKSQKCQERKKKEAKWGCQRPGPILENKGMRAIFQKKGKKGKKMGD